MARPRQNEVTRLLQAAGRGSKSAVDQLLPLVYDELRRLAQGYMEQERSGHTLQATALVHEAYLKLVDEDSLALPDRVQFFGAAATAMRRILVDHARTRRRVKRGGGAALAALNEALAAFEERAFDLVALDEALTSLAAIDERKARLVELRFFAGLSVNEAGDALGISLRTAERDWTMARVWLRSELERSESTA